MLLLNFGLGPYFARGSSPVRHSVYILSIGALFGREASQPFSLLSGQDCGSVSFRLFRRQTHSFLFGGFSLRCIGSDGSLPLGFELRGLGSRQGTEASIARGRLCAETDLGESLAEPNGGLLQELVCIAV